MISEIARQAINAVQVCEHAYTKLLSANDSGETKAHQMGILISTSAWRLVFYGDR